MTERAPKSPERTIGWTAAALAPFLVATRAWIIGGNLALPHVAVPRWIVAAYYDLSLLAVVTVVAIVVVRVYRPCARWAVGGHLVFALFSLLAALVNVVAIEMLQRPFTYPWLYYSDFLQSRAAAQAAASILTPRVMGVIVTTLVGFLALRYLLVRVRLPLSRRTVIATALVVGVGYFSTAGVYLSTRAMFRPGLLDNPIVAFARSLTPGAEPFLFTMEPAVEPEDVRVGWERGLGDGMRPASTAEPQASNVLVVVLESAGAPYYDLYGGSHGIGEHLMRRRGDMRLFTGVYAHAPATNKAMLSILCGTYPLISHETLTREHPTLPLGCLGDELQRRGYRTAYFGSSDLRFQRAEEFLAERGFDHIEGVRERRCDRPIIAQSTDEWPHADVSDDGCTAASAAAWIEADPASPFFAVVWTAMAHFPYHTTKPEHDFGVGDPFLNRYLNALAYADRVVNELLNRLDTAGLAESTLVVIAGDHGEAFGQHGYYVHSSIHEETARVPFVLLQPGRFHGETDDTVGGLVDLAPTVVDLLGLAPHGDWQGRSLFDPARSGRAYFYAPWSDYLFGYREGPLKVILNASSGDLSIYDVVADPGEQHNLRDQFPEFEEEALHRLASWVQYQDALWNRRTEGAMGILSGGRAPSP